MISKKDVRNYEVSLWTLQDSFISILKRSDIENRGTIQEPRMTIKNDGENNFSFKIPMYIREDSILDEEPYLKKDSILIENPIWYNIRDGILISDMRKIKVIFNKKTDIEEVFEFIITKIKESHEGYSKYCEVECEGLAFHELGKQGYQISLSNEDFILEYQEWDKGEREKKPIENINYWVEKVLENSNWGYEIQMDWSSYQIDQSEQQWDSKKIYQEPYISSWGLTENNLLIPQTVIVEEDRLEKIKSIDASESNRYNLLQKIAETFEVFTKYKYYYDENYRIIDRKVIFYNTYFNDKEEVIDFTYGYNTSQISREIDSMDLVTKMYIKPLKDSGTFSGEIKLSDSLANESLEEYLLNFDYLLKIGTITKDQYDEVDEFKRKMHRINSQMISETKKIAYIQNQIPNEQAKKNNAKDLISQANKIINKALAELKGVTGENAENSYPDINPLPFILIKPADNSNPYINISSTFGELNKASFKLYKKIDSLGTVVKNSICNSLGFEEKDGIVKKVILKDKNLDDIERVYATFSYKPDIPSRKNIQLWGSKMLQAKKDLADAENKLTLYKNLLKQYNKNIKLNSKEKQEIINAFERFMGPAIREGTWSPDDSYARCQSNETFSLENSNLIENLSTDRNKTVGFIWDSNLFENELEISYQYFLSEVEENSTRYYPCIDLTKIDINSLDIDNLNLVYRDYYYNTIENDEDYKDPSKNHYIPLGADDGLQFVFIKDIYNPDIIKPALVVLHARTLLDIEDTQDNIITPYQQIQKHARLSVVEYNDDGELEEDVIIDENSLASSWINENFDIERYEIVYPRFYNSSSKFLTLTPESMIYYGNKPLEENQDYYKLFRADEDNVLAYYLTLKPSSIIFKLNETYSFHYSLSTAADAIYLDALKIMRENSSPKVSYSITPLAKDISFIKEAYNKIGQLVHINDTDLKFENVQGYISEVDLNLDKPWEDSYTIKNYKTKFEDLFSTIVAQTQAMQRNSQTFVMTTNLFDSNGYINSELLNQSIEKSAESSEEIFEVLETSFLAAVTEDAMGALIEQVYKATSDAALILNGDIGLAFPSTDTIEGISLNNQVGLRIDGIMKRALTDENGKILTNPDGSYIYDEQHTIPSYFRVTNGAMGFFKRGTLNGKDEGMMYFDAATGDMALNGTLYAKAGGFGINNPNSPSDGWIIEQGKFYSLNGKAEFISGSRDGSPSITLKDDNDEDLFFVGKSNGTTILQLKGVINATGGQIGGWNISERAISSNNNSTYMSSDLSNVDNIAFCAGNGTFKVTHAGKLTATGAIISGALTATSLTVGDSNTMTYSSSAGLKIGTGNNFLEYKNGTLTVKGSITANAIVANTSITTPNISGGTINIGNGKFVVNNAGELTATAANISGTITATSGSIGSDNNTKKIILGDGVIRYNKDNLDDNKEGFYLSSSGISLGANNAFNVDRQGKLSANNVNITGGSFKIGGGNFEVTTGGILTAKGADISGTITATTGFIGSSKKITLGDGVIRYIKASLTDANAGFYLGSDGLALGANSKFKVESNGTLTANGGNFNRGTFQNITVNGSSTITGATKIDTNGANLSIKSDPFSITATKGEDCAEIVMRSSNCLISLNNKQEMYFGIHKTNDEDEDLSGIRLFENKISLIGKYVYFSKNPEDDGNLVQIAVDDSTMTVSNVSTAALWIEPTSTTKTTGSGSKKKTWKKCNVYYWQDSEGGGE